MHPSCWPHQPGKLMTRVLIVDDKEENLYYLQALLTGHGCAVETARHGAEALVKARQHPPELVVSDLLMPIMDGYTLLRHWKADDRLKRIPFIVYTATYTEAEDERLAFSLGADAFILKPAEPEDFLVRLREVKANASASIPPLTNQPVTDDKELLKVYSETLIRKLEQKTLQLEEANRALEQDIAERKRGERVQSWEARVLEAIASDQPLPAVLEKIALGVEEIIPAALGSILLVDRDRLRLGAAPSLPHTYNRGVDGMLIGPSAGSCGTAAHRGETVIVNDISTDPLWQDFRELAQAHGLQACWSTPVMDAAGKPLATVAVYYRERQLPGEQDRDLIARMVHLTRIAIERQRREKELYASEERFRLLSNATNDAIWDWDVVAGKQWWNEGFATLFGHQPGTLTPSHEAWAERVHPEDRDRVIAQVNQAVAGGQANFNSEYRFRRADGSYAYVLDRGHIIRDSSGKLARMIGGMTDLTTRRQAEEKLREQATLLDKAQDAILVRDLEHRVTYWNQSAERLYGWSAADACGQFVKNLIYRETKFFQTATECVLTTGEWTGELEQVTKDGRKLIIEGRWTLVRDDQGQPKAVLAINTDITEKKKLEAQFLRAQRMESIGTLAGGIAHDLNNVLAPIMMSVEFLRTKINDDDAASALETLSTCSQRGADLVRQVLSFGRGVEGKRLIVNPTHVLREIQKIARDTFPKAIQFRLLLGRDLWCVTGDPTQLHQVFLNLCVNARDAMPDGGTLSVTMGNVELDEIFTSANPEARPGLYVLTEVADTGPGIPPEVRDRIFEPFFTTKEVGKGTGLGLSTTLAIVKSHGGFINLESDPGKGAKFQVYLPATTKAASVGDADPGQLLRGNGELILVVDDEAGLRNVAQKTLERFGYRALLACHGAEAVSLYVLHRTQIAAVVTDMAMPVMDGANLIIALKTLNPDLKIIVSSGLASERNVQKAVDAGVKHFIPKPYTAQALLRELHAVLHDQTS